MKNLFKHCLYILLSLVLSACGEGDENTRAAETPLRTVRYQIITPIEAGTLRTFSGLAKAGQESNLSFRVGGALQSLPVEVGDQLSPGQLIAELDPSQYQLEAQQAVANLSQTQATLRNAQSNFERVKGLYENNNVSRNDLDSARATAESGEAQVSAARKALELARLNVSYTKLKASESCGVADIQAEVNENLSAGQTLVLVSCGDRLEVELAIPESMIALIKRGMNASVTFSAIPDKKFTAKVTEVSIASNSGSTYSVTVALTDKTTDVRSGLAAQVSFAFEMALGEQQFIVPAVAVGEDVSGRYVYLVEDTNTPGVGLIRKKNVSIGELEVNGLGIIDGVIEGDKVVIAGVNVIRDGLKVLID